MSVKLSVTWGFANWAQPNDSRCIVDYQTYYKFHQGSEAFKFSNESKATYDAWPETISNKAQLDGIHMILLPPGTHGFFMKEKKWGKFSQLSLLSDMANGKVYLLVDCIRPVSWNKAAFDRLVLPKRTKNLIKALVMVRNPKSENSAFQIGLRGNCDDIIAGKGSGLIMLLHGGPGTGKTLTAG